MKIYLVRHGQSQWQIERGEDWDTPLTELGHQQAQRLGLWLARHHTIDEQSRLDVTSLCASPLIRAQETAVYLAHTLNLPIITQEALREADFYVSEHLPQAKHPAIFQPSYEPSAQYATFKAQAKTALQALVKQAETNQGAVLAVAHGGLISTILRQVVGNDAISFWLYNTGINLIEWKRGRWHLVHLNLWDHLPPAIRTF